MKGYKYYSTQRPISLMTYPNPPDNRPVEVLNYDCDTRIAVQGENFQAWGELVYLKPLTERQISDYELKPSRHNPDPRGHLEGKPHEEPLFTLLLDTSHFRNMGQSSYRLPLPSSEENLKKALEEMGLQRLNDCHLAALECQMEDLLRLLPMDKDLESLNDLAQYLSEEFTPYGYEVLKAILEVERPCSYQEAYTLATDLYNYELINKEVELPEDYGAHVLYYSGRAGKDFEFPKEVEDFISYEKYGKYKMENDGIRITTYGMLRRIEPPFIPKSNGLDTADIV